MLFRSLTQGNTFKTMIQSGTNDKGNFPRNIIAILLILVFSKSYGDNGIDLTQRTTRLLNNFNVLCTCDTVLFLSAITAMAEGGVLLTTNTPDPNNPGRTGNLSTLFIPREQTPDEEIDLLFVSS